MINEAQIYALIDEEGFTRLVGAFYRQVPHDDILGKMYPPHDLAAAERRLRDFLIYRFGGPQRYIEERGHPDRQRAFVDALDEDTAVAVCIWLRDPANASSLLKHARAKARKRS